MRKPVKVLIAVTLAIITIGGLFFIWQQRANKAQHQLVELIPLIDSITVYDLDGGDSNDPTALSVATTAAFPTDVFQQTCSLATHKNVAPIWKGSSLAIITLNDHTRRQARFSYYGGFFTIEGISGHFIAPGASISDFQLLHQRLVHDQFVPQRSKK